MKFTVSRTSNIYDTEEHEEIEFNTLEDLIDWINEQEYAVIVYDGNLEINDGYRE